MWQNGLQSALGITKCGWVDYKVYQGLLNVAGLQSELVHKKVHQNSQDIDLFEI